MRHAHGGGFLMSRRGVMHGAGGPLGSPAGDGVPRKRYWWVYAAVAGGITVLWAVLSLPRTENPDEPMPFTTKRAGWPDYFARWSVSKETGQTTYSSFSIGSLVFDLVALAIPIAAACVIIRHQTRRRDQTPEQAADRR